jgi:DNA sulfur modification protein DndB
VTYPTQEATSRLAYPTGTEPTGSDDQPPQAQPRERSSREEAAINFIPSAVHADVGTLEMELESMDFILADGQHRCAAIALALKGNPAVGKQKISVLLFETESPDRLRQMFSHLNRAVPKPPRPLGIIPDPRDDLSALTMEVAESVEVFRGMVDEHNATIPRRSSKLFTFATLYDANEELLGKRIGKRESAAYSERLQGAVEYWTALSNVIDDWQKVKAGALSASELRQAKINTHAVVVRALGGVGRTLREKYREDWPEKLKRLAGIDWRKSVAHSTNPLWEDVCITAGSVVSNRQARAATLAVLLREIGESSNGRGASAEFPEAADG